MGTFRKSSKSRTKLRLALLGGHNTGKTLGGLLIARGLVGPEGSIGIIETEWSGGESTRSDLYADRINFSQSPIEPPFKVETAIERIDEAGKAGIDALLLDSLSDFWTGVGGLLAAAKSSKQRSFFTGDGKIRQARLMDAISRFPGHLVATIRLGEKYVNEDAKDGSGNSLGPQSRRVTLSPAQSADFGFTFNGVFEVDPNHRMWMRQGKIPIFKPGQAFLATEETGERLRAWLEDGASPYVARGDAGRALLALQGAGLSEQEAKEQLPGFPDQVTPAALEAARKLYRERVPASERKRARG